MKFSNMRFLVVITATTFCFVMTHAVQEFPEFSDVVDTSFDNNAKAQVEDVTLESNLFSDEQALQVSSDAPTTEQTDTHEAAHEVVNPIANEMHHEAVSAHDEQSLSSVVLQEVEGEKTDSFLQPELPTTEQDPVSQLFDKLPEEVAHDEGLPTQPVHNGTDKHEQAPSEHQEADKPPVEPPLPPLKPQQPAQADSSWASKLFSLDNHELMFAHESLQLLVRSLWQLVQVASGVTIVPFMGYKAVRHLKQIFTDEKERRNEHILHAAVYSAATAITLKAFCMYLTEQVAKHKLEIA